MNRSIFLLFVASFLLEMSSNLHAQNPEPIGENLFRSEGTDRVTGIHYLKLISVLKPANGADAKPESEPRFTMECREQNGRRSLHWLVRFDGSPDFSFQPPLVATNANPNQAPNPSATLKMRFEGYIRSEEFKRQWEVLPTGELHYRNPGLGSNNLDDPRHFLQWLTSLPSIRLTFAKPQQRPNTAEPLELLFALKPLLDAMKKTEFCQP